MERLVRNLEEWFSNEKRSLPWRENASPYSVWISEVMLQQTQVVVVTPYFLRWMQAFPNLHALAHASWDNVLKLWEGLGYYQRARYLHLGARYVVERFEGELPSSEEQLRTIPGIGLYTARAIMNFAFGIKSCVIDGNVLRVIARLFRIRLPVDRAEGRMQIEGYVSALLEYGSPYFSEALIEFGALICQKKPRCTECPLREQCQGREEAKTLPYKAASISTLYEKRYVGIWRFKNRVFVERRTGSLMNDLFEFPSAKTLEDLYHRMRGILTSYHQMTSMIQGTYHRYTRYCIELIPSVWQVTPHEMTEEWREVTSLPKLPFSSGHKRILSQLL